MMRLAAQTASWTSGGASSGAAARPSAWSLATGPATTGLSVGSSVPYSRPPDALVAGAGCAPPGSDVWADAGAAKANRPSSTVMMLGSERTRTQNLFRGPPGLADGLALKEPALPSPPG